ncbi:unnamed protein product [Owenia fusiformis]|uniref:CCZ1/INTU/HSP4 first Longin domain-containing protein n=1 Tax=Owenia fusiformis TaxID=6347 RepID=A0A8S4Q3M1_OWEFU|nr:unnamed protein product [Owenia fusiformis]
MAGLDGQMFFIYDHTVIQGEADDIKDAIKYFYPPSIDITSRCETCGQLMGMVGFFQEFCQSPPSIIQLQHDTYALKHCEQYTWALASASAEPIKSVERQLDKLFNTFTFYQHSLGEVQERCGGDGETFTRELQYIFDCYLPYVRCYGDPVASAFQSIPSVVLPKNGASIFLKASHMLQFSQRRAGVIAGCLFYKNRVLCSQLTSELTDRLLLIRAQQSHLPCKTITPSFNIPIGVRLISVHLTPEEFMMLCPLHHQERQRYTSIINFEGESRISQSSNGASSETVLEDNDSVFYAESSSTLQNGRLSRQNSSALHSRQGSSSDLDLSYSTSGDGYDPTGSPLKKDPLGRLTEVSEHGIATMAKYVKRYQTIDTDDSNNEDESPESNRLTVQADVHQSGNISSSPILKSPKSLKGVPREPDIEINQHYSRNPRKSLRDRVEDAIASQHESSTTNSIDSNSEDNTNSHNESSHNTHVNKEHMNQSDAKQSEEHTPDVQKPNTQQGSDIPHNQNVLENSKLENHGIQNNEITSIPSIEGQISESPNDLGTSNDQYNQNIGTAFQGTSSITPAEIEAINDSNTPSINAVEHVTNEVNNSVDKIGQIEEVNDTSARQDGAQVLKEMNSTNAMIGQNEAPVKCEEEVNNLDDKEGQNDNTENLVTDSGVDIKEQSSSSDENSSQTHRDNESTNLSRQLNDESIDTSNRLNKSGINSKQINIVSKQELNDSKQINIDSKQELNDSKQITIDSKQVPNDSNEGSRKIKKDLLTRRTLQILNAPLKDHKAQLEDGDDDKTPIYENIPSILPQAKSQPHDVTTNVTKPEPINIETPVADQSNPDDLNKPKKGKPNVPSHMVFDVSKIANLEEMSVFVQGHSEMVMLLLVENDMVNREATIQSLWRFALPQLAELEGMIKAVSSQKQNTPADHYYFIRYDSFQKTLEGLTLGASSGVTL